MHRRAGLVEIGSFTQSKLQRNPLAQTIASMPASLRLSRETGPGMFDLHLPLPLSRKLEAILLRYVVVHGPLEIFQRLVAPGEVWRQIIG